MVSMSSIFFSRQLPFMTSDLPFLPIQSAPQLSNFFSLAVEVGLQEHPSLLTCIAPCLSEEVTPFRVPPLRGECLFPPKQQIFQKITLAVHEPSDPLSNNGSHTIRHGGAPSGRTKIFFFSLCLGFFAQKFKYPRMRWCGVHNELPLITIFRIAAALKVRFFSFIAVNLPAGDFPRT